LRPDDDEADLLLLREGDDGFMVGDIERDAFGVLRDAGIAGRGVKPAQQRRGRNLPRQRMLAPARADQEYVHDWSSQFSIFNSPTRENSRPLRVTRMRERDKACPAINTSYGPIGLPA